MSVVPLYVLQALAEVRDSGNINMLDRRGVTAMVRSQRASEWLDKVSHGQYMLALQEMDNADSEEFLEDQMDESDDDEDTYFDLA